MKQHWPYPFWIAHRGAGTLAPENTLAAFRLGAACGWRMFECDAKLSRDGVPFLLHDATLERTTNGHGPAAACTWGELAQLDAGSWHARRWAGEALPTLAALVRWCAANHYLLNVELKPNPGQGYDTGRAVAQLLARLWPPALPAPLLSSFIPQALQGARDAAAHLPRALLLAAFTDTPANTAAARAQELGCAALVLHYPLWNAALVAQAHAAGLRCLSYTVNDDCAAQRLCDLQTDGIITDRVDYFSPAQQP